MLRDKGRLGLSRSPKSRPRYLGYQISSPSANWYPTSFVPMARPAKVQKGICAECVRRKYPHDTIILGHTHAPEVSSTIMVLTKMSFSNVSNQKSRESRKDRKSRKVEQKRKVEKGGSITHHPHHCRHWGNVAAILNIEMYCQIHPLPMPSYS